MTNPLTRMLHTSALLLIPSLLFLPVVPLFAGTLPAETAHRGIVSWADAVVTCGPGTDPAMDSPQAVANMVRRWKGRGLGGVYFRVDESMLPERFTVRWPAEKVHPVSNYLLVVPDRVHRSFDLLGALRHTADEIGFQIWGYYPTVYSNGAPPEGPGFTHRWLYENRYAHEHPEILSIDWQGRKHYMVWEYAYPGARAAKVAEYEYFARHHGLRRFLACLRTEAAQMQPPPRHADQFGFNAPVVEEMKRRYSVDILTDPRFDFTNPAYDLKDPMVENWRTLRGQYLTQFYRELREAMNKIDSKIEIAVQIPGDRAGSCLGNWHLDWRTWIDEGLVNELVVPVGLDDGVFRGTDHDPAKLGYLDASVPFDVYREFIRNSRQPTARLIQAGGPYLSFNPPPPGADGWRIDQWFDMYCLAWFQRWEQWKRDLADFGHIKFVEQDFNAFAENSAGYGGGFGDCAYRPDLRSCPGYWYTLGDGSDARPAAQSQVRRGSSGTALKLTRDEKGTGALVARHTSCHDRGGWAFLVDTAIVGGKCAWDYWVFRPDERSSLVAYLQYDGDPANRYEVGLLIGRGPDGVVRYSQNGKLTASDAKVTPGAWHRLSLEVDLERGTYSASLGTDPLVPICRDVKYASKHNAFNWMEFSPQGETASVIYLDDVSLRWLPSMVAAQPGPHVVLREGFESQRAVSTIHGTGPENGAAWSVRDGIAGDVTVDRDVSFGNELQSMRFRGMGGTAVISPQGLALAREDTITLDLDLLPRSDRPHLHFAPGQELATNDRTACGLYDSRTGEPVAAIMAMNGTWHCWSGDRFVDTSMPVALDAWSHLQLVVDTSQGSCRATIQVVGEPPRALWRGPCGKAPSPGSPLSVQCGCRRERSRADGPAVDNIVVTRAVKPSE
ncbi:MAG: hypothetical protein HUU20_06590 [Pirellulales bacterium]|nr:hypothetical protein [Pirellulales bacterium]